MDTEERKSVIRRKAKGARTEFDARVMSPAKALRLALAKVADKMFGLAVTVTTVEQLSLPHAKVQKEAGDDGLLLLLDGAAGARGAVKVDSQFLTALIEVQTTGGVRRAAADARRVTRTDAAIVAPLLDAVLRRYDQQLKAEISGYVEREFRFGDMMEDARTLSLALDSPEFDLFRLTLDIEDGAKTGLLTLMLPHREDAAKAGSTGETRSGASVSLEKNALEGQVVMDAVLTRIRMPLHEICALKEGMTLPLDAGCLSKTQMVASGGHVVARVRMGQVNGMRAVCFIAPTPLDAGKTEEKQAGKAGMKATAPEPAPAAPGRDDILEGVARPVPDPAPAGTVPDKPGAVAGPQMQSSGDGATIGDLTLLASVGANVAPDKHEDA